MRVNFNYFISDPVFRYVLDAVAFVADHGWLLLTDYRFDPATGMWRHRGGPVEPPMRLTEVHYDDDGVLTYAHHQETAPESVLVDYLEQARLLVEGRVEPTDLSAADGVDAGLTHDFEALRWFALPRTCLTP